ncbi:hypothetical protein [Halomonas kalidii]|uniref:GntR family transcriptional regulator n=1 Tax=Halomonas kalidii TaxID=3043293 RepID=A0ABT6VKL5_9GAMM|nr:hypothetical protein [Halomonas kalidii]MDI5933797.1 hypothetical protein [Halomonas kalidii]
MTRLNVTRKLIESHLLSGTMEPGEEIGLAIDQTLTQGRLGQPHPGRRGTGHVRHRCRRP